jgi:hypothetical protein
VLQGAAAGDRPLRRDASDGGLGLEQMPLPREVLEQVGEERLAAQRQAERERRRLWLRTGILCLLWPLLGLSLVAWSFHTTDAFHSEVVFWAGLGIGDGGTLFTLVSAWRKAERKGWL